MGGGKKLWYLESLRGIAALMVVFTHFAGFFFPAITGGPAYPTHSPVDLWFYRTPLIIGFGGNFAVCVFFVLSGFVLTRAFFATNRLDILAKAAAKRYFRLMPPVALSVLIAYVLLHFHLFFNQQAAAISGSTGVTAMWKFVPQLGEALNQAFYSSFIHETVGVSAYNPVLWTMQVEFLGSFLVFGLAALFGGRSRRGWMYIMLLIATWQTYYLGFAFGMILADLSNQRWWREVMNRRSGWTWSVLMFGGVLLGGYPGTGSTADTWYRLFPNLLENSIQAITTWHTLAATLVVLSVLGWTRMQRVLEWRPFIMLGRQSFGLYLLHFMVIATFASYLFKSLILSYGYRTSAAITIMVSSVVIFVVSYLYTRWVDQPSIAWANWMVRQIQREPDSRLTAENSSIDAPMLTPANKGLQAEN